MPQPLPSKQKVVISIGSNAPDALAAVENALQWLPTVVDVAQCSEPFFTPDERFSPDTSLAPSYCNAVAKGFTALESGTLRQRFKNYELQNGRIKGASIVAIDVDLVVYGNTVLKPDHLSSSYFRHGLSLLERH